MLRTFSVTAPEHDLLSELVAKAHVKEITKGVEADSKRMSVLRTVILKLNMARLPIHRLR